MMNKIFWTKAAIITACVLHTAYLVVGVFQGYLGANPIESLTHATGEWGLRLLLITLAITPLRRLLGWNVLARFRRLLGLCSFFYIMAHFSIFIVFDHFFNWGSIVEDIIERPYITVGFAAFVLMLPLVITSINMLQRKMGKHWRRLHQCVYAIGILGVVHYWWLVKADVLLPFIYALILMLLLGIRIYFYYRKKMRTSTIGQTI